MPDRSHWTVKKCSSLEEMRVHRIRQWQSMSAEERMAGAWELAVEYWTNYKGVHEDELRLQKTVINLRRAEG